MPVTYRLTPGADTYPGATTYPGVVGAAVELKVLIDLGNPTAVSPNWQYLSDERTRSFSISRGRESELTEIDTGTATLVVDNRDRAFDPSFASSPYNPYIRPLTRFWLQAEINGVAYSLFVGYAERYDQDWPEPGFGDANCTVSLSDEFKVLGLDALGTTNPPRDTYADLVQSDNPAGYWPMNEIPGLLVQPAASPTPAAEEPPPPAPPQDGTDFGFDFGSWYKRHWRNIPE